MELWQQTFVQKSNKMLWGGGWDGGGMCKKNSQYYGRRKILTVI